MKITKFLSACAIIASSFSFTSCDTETSGSYTTIAFVNYDGPATNGYSQYIYSLPNSSETITFSSKTNFLDGMTPAMGTRVIGQFTMEYGEEFKDGSVIENQGIFSLTKYGTVAIETISGNPISSTSIYLQAIMREGNYLDIMALADTKNSSMSLVCDDASLNTDTPVLYLNYEMTSNEASETQYFASFDISSVISRQDVKNIRVVINNSNGEGEFLFPIRN